MKIREFKEPISEDNRPESKAVVKREFDYLRNVLPKKGTKVSLHLKIMESNTKSETVWMQLSTKQFEEIEQILNKRG